MSDRSVKALLIAGLLAQAAAVGLGFTSLGWRWPLAAASAGIAVGIAIAARRGDALGFALTGFAALAFAVSVWYAVSPAPVASWLLWFVFALEALGQGLLLLFLLTFRMKRLW